MLNRRLSLRGAPLPAFLCLSWRSLSFRPASSPGGTGQEHRGSSTCPMSRYFRVMSQGHIQLRGSVLLPGQMSLCKDLDSQVQTSSRRSVRGHGAVDRAICWLLATGHKSLCPPAPEHRGPACEPVDTPGSLVIAPPQTATPPALQPRATHTSDGIDRGATWGWGPSTPGCPLICFLLSLQLNISRLPPRPQALYLLTRKLALLLWHCGGGGGEGSGTGP